MNHLSDFVTHYGYWAVVVGCLLEGETLLVLAGFAAKQGYLSLPLVMALGAAMGAASDMAFFWLGRRHGAAVLARWPHMNRYRQRLDDELERVALLPRSNKTPIDEIDASDADSSVSFTSQPTPRLVNDLFEKGAAAAEQYFAGLIRAHQEEHERQAGAAE